ncbi:zinc finger protein draculin-like isoform X6 [Pectinophora gossypiella]|uniref:zinc finger protein draculin-like isoform X6 n=1 Tax=Pectinophora gossypiella TaxID=13191 RepID=UPI00214E5607|nr:zinc finger protein draculin-like isoform X6 [Pectinophora gossypiella]
MTAKSSDWRPGPSVCRCCFAEGCYKDISTEYFWMGKREVYQEMLSTTFDVSISYAQSGGPNSNSRLICEPCIARLRDASDFKRQVQECERVFHQHLDPTSSVSELEAVVVEPPGKEVKLERVKVESKLSDDEDFDDHAFVDDDDDDLDDQPLTALATKVPKKESVDLMDLLDNAKPEKRKAAAKPKTPPAKKAKKKESPKPSASKPAPKPVEKKRKGDEISKGKAELNKGSSRGVDELDIIKTTKLRRDSAVQLMLNSKIIPFKWSKTLFMCFYCIEKFVKFEELKKHCAFKHDSLTQDKVMKSVYKMKRFELAKVNVADANCRLCEEKIVSFNELKLHLSEKHKIIEIDIKNDVVLPFSIVNEEYFCAICREKFADFRNLNNHMNVHFKNFICHQCGAGFITPGRLKVHVTTHEAGHFPCNICGKEFRNHAARSAHHAIVHLNAKRSKCPHCSETFKTYYQKKKHIITAHELKVSEFRCNMCPKTFLVSGSLLEHKRHVHLKAKRYSCHICDWKFYHKCKLKEHMISHGDVVKKFECSVCKKSYARKHTLTEHMRIHNNDRRFVCEYCNSAFVQKCSLQSHVRTHHAQHLNQGDRSPTP